ncbi:MAG: M4 family metallopeptidase, partial [Candidatus Hydrogenedentes bacterium]|nr:M4 family metallopeptidase [Candidatus Hydrogenedentota bacterium]
MRAWVFLTVVAVAFVSFPADGQGPARANPEDVQGVLRTLHAATATELPRIVNTDSGFLTFIGAPPGTQFSPEPSLSKTNNPEAIARGYLSLHAGAFFAKSAGFGFATVRIPQSGGRSYVHLGQTYQGLPVFGAEVMVQVNASGGIDCILSDLMQDPSLLDNRTVSTTPSVAAGQAKAAAITSLKSRYPTEDFAVVSEPKLIIYDPGVLGAAGPVELAWQTQVFATTTPLIREAVFIDAHSGGIALNYSLVESAKKREIYDSDNTEDDPGTLVRAEGGPVSTIVDVNQAYDFLGDTYDFYANENGRDSIDGLGYTLSATVRFCFFGCPMQNAFWDGFRMYFGEGFAVDDVAAHELTHGVTQYTSNLIYYRESGAINESFSDVWGEWVDLTNGAGSDTPDDRWYLGEDVPEFGAIRYMKDPTVFGDPDRYRSPLYYKGPFDNGGVHWNSGVGNKLCYLLTDGDQFNGQIVTGMGISRAADLFYEVQTNLLNVSSKYRDLGSAMVRAAINLNFDEIEQFNVQAATLAVEILPPQPVLPGLREFRATSDTATGKVVLTWKNPQAPNFKQIIIRRKDDGFPTKEDDGTLVYSGKGDQASADVKKTDDAVVSPTTEYYYGIFAEYLGDVFPPDQKLFARAVTGANLPDFLTEAFAAGTDLSFSQILFTPTVDLTKAQDSGNPTSYTNYYNYTASIRHDVYTLPEPRVGAVRMLPLDEGFATIPSITPNPLAGDLEPFGIKHPIPFFGGLTQSLTLAGNGYIMPAPPSDDFATDLRNFPSIETHFQVPRLSFLFANLDPNSLGEVWAKGMDDKFVITLERVSEHGSIKSNTVQVELFYSGHIRVTYLELNVQNAVVGLSDGNGIPLDPATFEPKTTNLSNLALPSRLTLEPIPLQLVKEQDLVSFTAQANAAPGGAPLVITAEPLPTNPAATFTVSGDKGVFDWQTDYTSSGTYTIYVKARQGTDEASQNVLVVVSDMDQLPDAVSLG